MTPGAKALWIEFYDDGRRRIAAEENELLRSVMSKLEGATARFALIHQLASNPSSISVEEVAMDSAIKLSRWFESQARRAYCGIDKKEEYKERRIVLEWIEGKGGRTTLHIFANSGPNRLRKRAREVLDGLVTDGLLDRRKHSGGWEYVLKNSDD
jgi:hypothetical protein